MNLDSIALAQRQLFDSISVRNEKATSCNEMQFFLIKNYGFQFKNVRVYEVVEWIIEEYKLTTSFERFIEFGCFSNKI